MAMVYICLTVPARGIARPGVRPTAWELAIGHLFARLQAVVAYPSDILWVEMNLKIKQLR